MQNVQKITKTGSIIEITGTLQADLLQKERGHMIEILSKQVQVDGFRSGSVPEAMIVAKVGEEYVKEKTAEHALDHELHHILVEHKVLPIVPPHVSVKLQPDGSAHVTITATVYPTITLPDYRKIAKDVMTGRAEVSVTDADVLDALTHFRRERMRVELYEAHRNAPVAPTDVSVSSPEAEAQKKLDEKLAEVEKLDAESLPPLDADFVKQIGFDSVEAFEEHVKKELATGKKEQDRSERRAKMLAEICKDSVADVPEPLVEYELAKMDAGLADYLQQGGKTLDQYYASIQKTKADIHAEWKPEATKRAQHQLALIEIAKRENISEDAKELAALVEDVTKRQPTADKHAVEAHYQVILRNEKVLSWLESQ